ncbi:MAG TPA: 50S ribosomal protein L6 [Bacillota bacterium]
MSRVGKAPIPIPDQVQVEVDGNAVRVKGPKGELVRELPPAMRVRVADGALIVERPSDERQHKALHGLTRSLLANMVEGVTRGYQKTLVLEGVGYRASKQGEKLVLSLGYSHPVEFVPPPGIELEVPQPTTIIVRGTDKELVGNVAASIRARRPLSRFKYADGPRGIRYADEQPTLKPVKAGK